jgi:hypothetical protein
VGVVRSEFRKRKTKIWQHTSVFVGDNLRFSLLRYVRDLLVNGSIGRAHTGDVKAMELYEFPNEIPIATRSAGAASSLIFGGFVCFAMCIV